MRRTIFVVLPALPASAVTAVFRPARHDVVKRAAGTVLVIDAIDGLTD